MHSVGREDKMEQQNLQDNTDIEIGVILNKVDMSKQGYYGKYYGKYGDKKTEKK